MIYTCIAEDDGERCELAAETPADAAERMLEEIQDLSCTRRNSDVIDEVIKVVGYGRFNVTLDRRVKITATAISEDETNA